MEEATEKKHCTAKKQATTLGARRAHTRSESAIQKSIFHTYQATTYEQKTHNWTSWGVTVPQVQPGRAPPPIFDTFSRNLQQAALQISKKKRRIEKSSQQYLCFTLVHDKTTDGGKHAHQGGSHSDITKRNKQIKRATWR